MASSSKQNSEFRLESVDNRTRDVPVTHDPEKERHLVRKLDRVILPWVMLMYLLSYMDRFPSP